MIKNNRFGEAHLSTEGREILSAGQDQVDSGGPNPEKRVAEEHKTDESVTTAPFYSDTLLACALIAFAAVLLVAALAAFITINRKRKRNLARQCYEQVPEDGLSSRKSSMKPNDPTLYVQNRKIDFVVPSFSTALAPISSPDTTSLSSSSPDIPGWSKLALIDSTNSLAMSGLSLLGGLNPELYRMAAEEAEEEVCFPDGHRGRLWFAVEYDASAERLRVKLIKAKNLPSRTYGSLNCCDPFVRIYIMPDERRYSQSKFKKKTCNPKFDEIFVFQVPVKMMEERSLKLTVYDNDRGKRHNIIGHVMHPLKGLDTSNSEAVVMWQDLETEVHEVVVSSSGEILVSLCYNQNLERLTATVFEGRGLRLPDGSSSVDSYVKVSFLMENKMVKSKKTVVAKKTTEPKYNESFNFRLTPNTINAASTIIQVNLVGTNQKDKCLGRVVLGSYMFARGKALEHWNEATSSQRQVRHWHKLT